MSTSLLYHAFGARGIEYQRTEYREGGLYFFVAFARRFSVALIVGVPT